MRNQSITKLAKYEDNEIVIYELRQYWYFVTTRTINDTNDSHRNSKFHITITIYRSNDDHNSYDDNNDDNNDDNHKFMCQ